MVACQKGAYNQWSPVRRGPTISDRQSEGAGSFYRRLFSYIGLYKYKTSAFVTGKCHLKVKSAGGTSQDGVNMASKWRILDMRIEEMGTSFHESQTSG